MGFLTSIGSALLGPVIGKASTWLGGQLFGKAKGAVIAPVIDEGVTTIVAKTVPIGAVHPTLGTTATAPTLTQAQATAQLTADFIDLAEALLAPPTAAEIAAGEKAPNAFALPVAKLVATIGIPLLVGAEYDRYTNIIDVVAETIADVVPPVVAPAEGA